MKVTEGTVFETKIKSLLVSAALRAAADEIDRTKIDDNNEIIARALSVLRELKLIDF